MHHVDTTGHIQCIWHGYSRIKWSCRYNKRNNIIILVEFLAIHAHDDPAVLQTRVRLLEITHVLEAALCHIIAQSSAWTIELK